DGKGASLVKLKNGRTLEQSASDITTALDIGAVGDGSTDDSAAINASNKVLQITSGNYAVASLSRAESFSMDPGAFLLFNGPSSGTLLDCVRRRKTIGHLTATGVSQNCTLAKISGDNNQIGTVILTGVTASATGTPSLFGL